MWGNAQPAEPAAAADMGKISRLCALFHYQGGIMNKQENKGVVDMTEVRAVRIPLRAANSWLVAGDKTVIVDTGNPGYSIKILDAMQANDIKKSDVSMILLTHGHIDHFGSVYELKKKLDVPVAIHKMDEPYLLAGTQAPLYPTHAAARLIKAIGQDMQVKKRYNLQADIIFEDEMALDEYGLDAKVVATPGHTLGSASLVMPGGKAVVGDLLVRRYLLFGRPVRPPFLNDKSLHTNSVQKLLAMGVTEFLPGHGPLIALQELSKGLSGRS